MNARHTEKLSIYFLSYPGDSLFLALDVNIRAPIPKITVVMLITAIDTILFTSYVNPKIAKLRQLIDKAFIRIFFYGYYNPSYFP